MKPDFDLFLLKDQKGGDEEASFEDWLRAADELTARAREALTIIGAIRDARLLTPPADVADRQHHATAAALLEMVEVRLREALSAHALHVVEGRAVAGKSAPSLSRDLSSAPMKDAG